MCGVERKLTGITGLLLFFFLIIKVNSIEQGLPSLWDLMTADLRWS